MLLSIEFQAGMGRDMGLGKQGKLNLPAREREKEKGGGVGLSQEPPPLPQSHDLQ
jgi:hypothetical protein